jgi:hypothetical protein
MTARRNANMLGDFEDPTLAEALQAKSRAYQELQQRNAGLLDWYRLVSFALTGHTASTRLKEELPTQPTLSSSVFGVDCLPELTTSIDPFFVQLDGLCAPAWGVFWEWVLTGALKEWLPKADSLEQSLELLRKRELRVVSQQWDSTADADRFELLRGWLSGPGAIYPARVAGLRKAADLPPVSQAAPINRQLRVRHHSSKSISGCKRGLLGVINQTKQDIWVTTHLSSANYRESYNGLACYDCPLSTICNLGWDPYMWKSSKPGSEFKSLRCAARPQNK